MPVTYSQGHAYTQNEVWKKIVWFIPYNTSSIELELLLGKESLLHMNGTWDAWIMTDIISGLNDTYMIEWEYGEGN